MKVLVLDDDPVLRSDVARWLRRSSFAVDEAASLGDARELLSYIGYDCMVLDRLVQDGDSLDLVTSLRAQGDVTPVLFFSCRRTDTKDCVDGLAIGADDYVVKPVPRAELVARVEALCRRRSPSRSPVITVGDLVIDTGRQRVERGGATAALTSREFAVLTTLARRPGEIVSQTELIEQCWGEREQPMSNTVEVHVARLRRKLGEPPLIHTVKGAGYSLVEPTP